jgi:hypothetical protein
MSTQQQERTATAPDVTLPAQRTGDHDAWVQRAAPSAPQGWSTRADRAACRWMCVAMLVLGLYASLMVWLSARVW